MTQVEHILLATIILLLGANIIITIVKIWMDSDLISSRDLIRSLIEENKHMRKKLKEGRASKK